MHQAAKPAEQVIFQTKDIDDKRYVREQKGFYQGIRRRLAWLLCLLFLLLPLVQYRGQQAILFDIAEQKFNVFAWSFYPQDLMLFVFIFLFSAFALFYLATKYGRVWCGYTCPQTVWTMMFLWVEHRIEGNRQAKIKLAKSPWGLRKLVIKLTKHLIWLAIASITATVFIAYFIPARTLYLELASFEASSLVVNWIAFFTLCTYINAGFIREKMCEHMCPYSRFQSVMMSKNTKVIGYDRQRGEGRGARKIHQPIADNLGDCVDCKLCVQVCPVGIDIRDGLQYECISCGLCIDACDQTMDKFGYQRGLIKYVSEVLDNHNRWRHWSYILVMMAIVSASILWLSNRGDFEVAVFKDRHILYREVAGQWLENSYQLKIFNKSQTDSQYYVAVADLPGAMIKSSQSLNAIFVASGQRNTLTFRVLLPLDEASQHSNIYFNVVKAGEARISKVKASFYAPHLSKTSEAQP